MSDYSDNESFYSDISDADSHYTSNPESDFSEIIIEEDENNEKYILRKFGQEVEVLDAPDSLFKLMSSDQHKKIKYLYKKHNDKSIFEEVMDEMKKPPEEEEEIGKKYSILDKKGLTIDLEIVEESDLLTKFGYIEIKKFPPYFKKLKKEEKIRRLENLLEEHFKNEKPKEPPPETKYTGFNMQDTKCVHDINYHKRQTKPKNEKSLTEMNKNELIEKAKDSGFKRLTKKTKQELIDIIKGNIKKKEQIVFTSKNERRIFPSIYKAAKEMKISSSQIHYKMGAFKIINGVEWKITRE